MSIPFRTIERPGSDLVLARNADDDRWLLVRRQLNGSLYNLAAPPNKLPINQRAILLDGAGDPAEFLDAAIAGESGPVPAPCCDL